MKIFKLYRPEKEADGVAYLAADVNPLEACLFSDGHLAVRWLTVGHSTALWPSLEDFMAIHGHEEYGTYIVWDDNTKQTWRDGKLITLGALPMISVASLENSKKLHEVSGWTTNRVHHDVSEVDENGSIVKHHWRIFDDSIIQVSTDNPPVYDLSFLLDKLKKFEVGVQFVGKDTQLKTYRARKEVLGKYIAWTPTMIFGDYPYADNPCDPVCLIAINLFENNILKKGVH